MIDLRDSVPVARRRFVRTAALGAAGSALAMWVAGFGLLLWPTKTDAVGNVGTVAAHEVPAVNEPPFLSIAGRFYLMIHNADGLLALSWRCTFKGCRTLWRGPVKSKAAYRCPCCGSSYNDKGEPTDGPAPRPLDLMQLAVKSDGSVRVDTKSVSSRASYSPDQAAPYPA